MPICWQNALLPGTIAIVLTDSYTFAEWRGVIHEIFRTPRAASMRVLVDGRECSPPTATFVEDALALWRDYADAIGARRFAFVATADATYGMSRFAEQ